MKKIFAAVALLFVLTACGDGNEAALENTQWKLVKANGIPAEAINREADFFTMTFDAGQQMVTGRTNCNRFFGHYQVTGREIDFENMGMTRMACPEMEYETMFAHMLDEADHFKVRDGELYLYDDKREIAVFKAVKGDAKATENRSNGRNSAAAVPAAADSLRTKTDAAIPTEAHDGQLKREERREMREERKQTRDHREDATHAGSGTQTSAKR